jgi:hypothetical protein
VRGGFGVSWWNFVDPKQLFAIFYLGKFPQMTPLDDCIDRSLGTACRRALRAICFTKRVHNFQGQPTTIH